MLHQALMVHQVETNQAVASAGARADPGLNVAQLVVREFDWFQGFGSNGGLARTSLSPVDFRSGQQTASPRRRRHPEKTVGPVYSHRWTDVPA